MDPLSIAANVVAVIGGTLQTARALYDLRSKFQDASITITSIYSESMVISASLSQVQALLAHDALQNKPDLRATFDIALTGCMVVYSCLDVEVQRLAGSVPQGGELGWREKARVVWEEDRMRELLQQIRGQQSAMTLLIQGLQMESLGDIKRLLRDNSATLEQAITRSKSLRSTHPRIHVPDSIFQVDYRARSGNDANSITSQAEFEFDDQVVDSKAYRRAMAAAEARVEKPEAQIEVIEGDLINFDDPEGEPQAQALSDTLEELRNLDFSEKGSIIPPPVVGEQYDPFLDDIERTYLPFMPPLTSTNTGSTVNVMGHSRGEKSGPRTIAEPALRSHDQSSIEKSEPRTDAEPALRSQDQSPIEEERPPLPPRRSAANTALAQPLATQSTDQSSYLSSNVDDSWSAISSVSSRTAVESVATADSQIARSEDSSPRLAATSSIPQRKPLSGASQSNLDLFRTLSSEGDDIKVVSAKEMERHNIWYDVLQSEAELISRLTHFHQVFVVPMLVKWPVLAKHLEAFQMTEELIALHRDHLQMPLRKQINQNAFAICDPYILSMWVSKSQAAYQTYHQRLPHAQHAIRLTLSNDTKFRGFVNTLGLRAVWPGKTWEDFSNLPMQQLQTYIDSLASILRSYNASPSNPADRRDVEALKSALGSLKRLQTSCETIQDRLLRREQIQTLYRRIQTVNAEYLNVLELSDPSRKIIYQGALAIRVKGKGAWLPVHAVLLDNNLFWGKAKMSRFSDMKSNTAADGKFWVLEEPLFNTELSLTLPDVDHQFIRASITDEVSRGSVIYQFFVKTNTHAHTLGAFSVRDREMWVDKIREAISFKESKEGHSTSTTISQLPDAV